MKDISFSVKKGTIHGFLGPNGAGKSTTMKIISGNLLPCSGELYINENLVDPHESKWAEMIGLLPELPPLYKNMTVRNFLSFVFDVYSNDKKIKKEYVNSSIEKCGLSNVQNKVIGNLSKGYKQRVGIAQAIVFDPEIVILDEPTSGLDPEAIYEINKLIEGLKGNHTVLLSSHRLHEIDGLCEEITLIDNGRIIRSCSYEQMKIDLNTEQHFVIKVKAWSKDIELDFYKKFNLDTIKTKKILNETIIECSLIEKSDQREGILKFLFERKCDLLEFYKEDLGLDGIFRKAIKVQRENNELH